MPANVDAERAVNGAILLNREAILAVAAWLEPDHFYSQEQAWIYGAARACYARRVPPDYQTVAAELAAQGHLDQVGGSLALMEVVDSCPTSYHIEHYAHVVERLAIQRGLILAGGRIARIGYTQGDDLDQAIGDAQACLLLATTRASGSGFVPYADIAMEVYEQYSQEEGQAIGISTGYTDLDELLIGGFHKQDLILLAARPSVGKSALAGCLAAHVGAAEEPVLVYSLEMARDAWFARNAAALSGVNLAGVRARRLGQHQLEGFLGAVGQAGSLPIYVNDTPIQTMASIRSETLKWIATHGRAPGLVILDYIQLLASSGKVESRALEVGKMSQALKQLAREVDAPVLAISQLSRAVEGRPSHVPMLSDLRESGALEQDADVVMFIYREELYDKDSDKKGIAELYIAKHRNGPLGVVPMRFDASTTSFHDLTYREPDHPTPTTPTSYDGLWPTYDD
jgi:replicative DNA helicase